MSDNILLHALNYRYRCEPTDGLPALMSEHEKMKIFWNILVDIHREFEKALFDQAAADVPRIAEINAEILSYSERTLDTELKKILRTLRMERRKLHMAWRKENKDFVKEKNAIRLQAIKEARQKSNLYWANYNSAIAKHEATRQTCYKKGRTLQYFDEDRDNGAIYIQIQRTKTGLGASPQELHNGLTMIGVEPSDDGRTGRRANTRTIGYIRVDADGTLLRFKVNLHRPLPPTCRIKGAILSWRRVGRRIRYHLLFNVTDVPTVQTVAYKRTGELSLMWDEYAGGLRVAQIGNESLVLPAKWVRQMKHVSHLRALLDESKKGAKEMFPALVAVLELPERDMINVTLTSKNKKLQAWRKDWVRMWEEMHNKRDRLLERRKEIYWVWTKQIVNEYTDIILDDLDLARRAMIDRFKPENSLRTMAAVFSLQQKIVHQANKIGATVRTPDTENKPGKVLTSWNNERKATWAQRKEGKQKAESKAQANA